MPIEFKIGDIVKVSTLVGISKSGRIAKVKNITESRFPLNYPNSRTYHLEWLDDEEDGIRNDFLWPMFESDTMEHVENALQRLKRRYSGV